MVRVLLLLAALSALFANAAQAQQNGFDLAGPDVSVMVRRGDVELPVAAVPALRSGDTLTAKALLPDDQAARYLLVVAFLRGATNPPPKDWFFSVETWNRKKNVLTVTVPEGAEQVLLFLAPEAGGGFSAVRGAVRGRPGVFVRAAQDLYQASLDRQRLDAFVGAIGRIGERAPERLATAAPVLADALRIKLNADCLLRQRALQATCLTQQRDSLVLQAQRGATLTETLTGAPVDLAYRVAATREGGAGYYSPYIGLARDLARLFGAFRSAQYQYLPALALGQGQAIHLQLNSAPSFQNPRSVLVAPLPPIGDAPPPLWRSAAPGALCLAKPDLVLPLDDASLLFATDYARDLVLRVTGADGKVATLPLTPDAERGGLVLATGAVQAAGPVTEAVVQGRWGFDAFSGPRVPAQLDGPGAWTAQPDATVIVGRDHPLTLRGGAAACVAGLTLRDAAGLSRSLTWKSAAPDALDVTLPLAKTRPGALALTVVRFGAVAPDQIALTGRAEPSRLDRFTIHAGDREGVLEGARLDQVTGLTLGATRFAAGTLTRVGEGDRLTLSSEQPLAEAGENAAVQLRDGRTATVAATIAPARPVATLLDRRVAYDTPTGALPIELPEGLVPTGATLTFSTRIAGGLSGGEDGVEIANGDTTKRLTIASGAVQRVGDDIAVTTIAPQTAFGAAAAGALRFRPWRGGAAGAWQPLGSLVRLPVLSGVACRERCTVSGRDLFVVAAIGTTPDMKDATPLPAGFVGGSVEVPAMQDALYLRLHDAPDAVLRVKMPAK